MFEWHKTIQRMINIIERQIKSGADDCLALTALATELRYSPYHVTRQFKRLTGMTFRDYLRLRRLAHSVVELRDTDRGVIDIAVQYGFSSQEAFTRAFKEAYDVTPCHYRRKKMPLPLMGKRYPFDPHLLGLGESSMSKKELQEVTISVVTLPAHKFLFVKNADADNYFGFWELQDKKPGQDCDTICGLLDSISSGLDRVTGKIGEFDGQIGAFWYTDCGKQGYAYGMRLPADFSGALPKQMECIDVPQRDYLVFAHPPFDYEKICESVNMAVEKAYESYDFAANGVAEDKAAFTYQIHNPEHVGYRLYVPVK